MLCLTIAADWKAKLFVETGAELKAGKSYRITYNIKADKSFDYNVFYNNGAEEKAVGEFYDLKAGSAQTVQHVVSPVQGCRAEHPADARQERGQEQGDDQRRQGRGDRRCRLRGPSAHQLLGA